MRIESEDIHLQSQVSTQDCDASLTGSAASVVLRCGVAERSSRFGEVENRKCTGLNAVEDRE